MRREIRVGMVTALAAMMLITSGCNSKQVEPVTDIAPVVAVSETKEFINSNYHKWFYSKQDSEKKYVETMKELVKVEGLYTKIGRKQIYKDKSDNYVFVSGYMPIIADFGDDHQKMFREKTGFRMHPFEQDADRAKSLARIDTMNALLKEDYINLDKVKNTVYVNDQSMKVEKAGEAVKDSEYAINLGVLNFIKTPDVTFEYTESEVKITVDPIVSEAYTVSIPISKMDYSEIVDEATKNVYYCAKYDEGTGDLFIPSVVIKNILGWDCTYNSEKDVACIVTNDTYSIQSDLMFSDTPQDKLGETKNKGIISGMKEIKDKFTDLRIDEMGAVLVLTKDEKMKPEEQGVPVAAKPVEQPKPTAPDKPAPKSDKPDKPAEKPNPPAEKPKPVEQAPTYTNTFTNTTYLCNGVGSNPPLLPPTDGGGWWWHPLKEEWKWSDNKNDGKKGQQGEDMTIPEDYVIGDHKGFNMAGDDDE